MKIKVQGLKVLQVNKVPAKDYDIDGNVITVAAHTSFSCYDSGSNTLVNTRDFKNEYTYKVGDEISGEFDVRISKLDNK